MFNCSQLCAIRRWEICFSTHLSVCLSACLSLYLSKDPCKRTQHFPNIVFDILEKRWYLGYQGPCKQTQQLSTVMWVPYKRVQHVGFALHRSQNKWNVGNCCTESLTDFKQLATSANMPCKGCNMLGPTILPIVGQWCCVRLHGPKNGLDYPIRSIATFGSLLFWGVRCIMLVAALGHGVLYFYFHSFYSGSSLP